MMSVEKMQQDNRQGRREIKTKKIFSLGLAKGLLALGYVIVGLEYNRQQDKQVYIFKVEGEFEKDFSKLQNNRIF